MKKKYINNQLHLSVQTVIKEMFNEPIFLEYRLKGHIADIYLPEKKIVFEVQCSPISLEEVKLRTKDLENLGLYVIWILHEKTFNKKHLSPSEEYLVKEKHSYYSNISQAKEGWVYTQEEVIFDFTRLYKSSPIEINLSKLYYKKFSRKVYFKNDLTFLGPAKRIMKYPIIWKLKQKIFLSIIKREVCYFYAYLKWKISL